MVKILCCGDFVSFHPELIKIDSEIKLIFNNCDIKMCNFEAPIKCEGLPTHKSGPTLYQSEKSPKFLEDLGYNIIQLSNNHLFDFGIEGYESTKASFKTSILIGAGTKEEAFKIKSIYVNSLKIGLMSLTHYEFGTLGLDSNEKDKGCAWINHPLVNQNIINYKDQYDYLFVLPHAGIEEINAPLPEWRVRYKELIDLGVDGIFASHPHVPQGWETYKGKPIFYSLGNFIFETNWPIKNKLWNEGLMIELTLSNNKKINYTVYNTQYNNGYLQLNLSKEIIAHTKEICDVLNNNDQYLNYINTEVLNLWHIYNILFLRGLGAFSVKLNLFEMLKNIYCLIFRKRNIPMLINNLRCESHRWAILRALDLQNNK